MLFPYIYVPHQMEKMQSFIDFIFYEVWCNAPAGGPFSLSLFDANAELREMMDALYHSDAKGAYFFSGHVERIYCLFSALTAVEISRFKLWYQGNNDLEKVCANDPGVQLLRYREVTSLHPRLGKQLANFFRGLYDSSVLGLSVIRARVGDIKDHNKRFFEVNGEGKCPFCGISDLKGIHHTRREAYDHYLPKYRYPFNSINFRNLAPSCHECNSAYKLSKDPLQNPAGRRKAFYPFSTAKQCIDIQVILQNFDIENLQPADVEIQFGPAALVEELGTWRDVYGIEERYKAKICGKNEGRYWLTQVVEEGRAYGKQPPEILAMRARLAESDPYADCNFLRKPFLDACQLIGVI